MNHTAYQIGRQSCENCDIYLPRPETNKEHPQPRYAHPPTQREYVIASMPSFTLHFSPVERVMNLYRSGQPYETALQTLAVRPSWTTSSRTYFWSQSQSVPHVTKLEVEPRIVHGNFMIRTCQRVLVTRPMLDILDRSDPHCTYGKFVVGIMHICPHHGYILEIIDAVNGFIAVGGSDPGTEFAGTLRCECCLTEATMACYHHPGQGFEFVLNTWTNFGPCQCGYDFGWRIASLEGFGRLFSATWQQAIQNAQSTLGYPEDYDDPDDKWVRHRKDLLLPSPARTIQEMRLPGTATDPLSCAMPVSPTASEQHDADYARESSPARGILADLCPAYTASDDPPAYEVLESIQTYNATNTSRARRATSLPEVSNTEPPTTIQDSIKRAVAYLFSLAGAPSVPRPGPLGQS